MAVTIQNQRTSQFLDPWPHLAIVAIALICLALLSSLIVPKTLLSTSLQVSEDEPAFLQPIQLKRELIGALRIDVKAIIPNNQWVTYEIQILDRDRKVIASGIKQAWNEAGTWQEEGESGSWQEDDLWGGLDVRPVQEESITVAISVLEYSDTAGREIDRPVSFQVTVHDRAIDRRYLWAGLYGSALFWGIACIAVTTTGKSVIHKTLNDSDVGDRGLLGGSNRLVQVNVEIKSDETSPQSLNVHLFVKDGVGEQIYQKVFPVKLNIKRENGKIERANGNLTTWFVFQKRGSYGFYVEVVPDGPVDRTSLTVRDGVRTLTPVEVIKIST